MDNLEVNEVEAYYASGYYVSMAIDVAVHKVYRNWAIIHWRRAMSGKGIVQ